MDNEVFLLDIPWEDVLFKKVLPQLTLKDLFHLRSVSTSFKCLINSYFIFIQTINLARYKSFNNVAFKVLLTHCKNVKTLNLSRCTWLDKNDIIEFFKNNPKLYEINLSYSNEIVNILIHQCVLHCRNIKKVNLSYSDLTVGALETVIFHLEDVHTIDLSRCALLTEKCLMKLVVRFHNVKNLFLMGITAVSDRVLVTIAQHCKQLENLNIDNCTITMSIISILRKGCPNLESVRACGMLFMFPKGLRLNIYNNRSV